MWNHAGCIFKKGSQIKSLDDVEGVDLLRWEDQQKINKYVENGPSSKAITTSNECAIEISQTSRATCRCCNEKILKGMVRVSTKPEGQNAKGLSWQHVNCFIKMSPSTNMEKVSGWDGIPPQDKVTISSLFQKEISTTKSGAAHAINDVQVQPTSSKGTKRRKIGSDEQNSNIPKTAGLSFKGKAVDLKNSNSSPIAFQNELEQQSNALWDVKDELKSQVTTRELREMLEANEQDSGGPENDLRDRCADGMLFGALGSCPICSGFLHYSGGQYRCHGYLSAWTKCSYSTTEPVRLKEKWKIPKGASNQFLLEWFKSQKAKKPLRFLPPSSTKPSDSLITLQSQSSIGEGLENLKVALSGKFQGAIDEVKRKLEEAGGKVFAKVKKDISCLVVGEEVDESEIRKAKIMKIPIVRENFLSDCLGKQKILPLALYKIEAASETPRSGMVTVKVKGQSAVHESSGLQESGHILEDGKSIYNTTLNMSDLSTGINSYYILQVIQEDKGSGCYIFRKWGRVGNEKVGGYKLEEMSKSDAIHEFKRLFLEKTGNPWEAWELKQNFEKQPGRFLPLDIDYGVKHLPKKKNSTYEETLLAPELIELMKMLFNVETYRAAMLEFEIDMSEMPLGKLSKQNIQKGFQALTEIQDLLNNNGSYDPSLRESLIVDASNRFFTIIPSIHPHVIKDVNDFKAKVKMLEALQNIEIASKLVDFDIDDSINEKYKRLKCDIAPLPHDSENYKLIKHYLLNTHAPTHTDWSLELEEVFALEREGESHKYASFRHKLHNRMLLWHGSRLTNFVGILSQGLRIAPPEAPATGYMFGKGVYFADLVSKSAQYCYVDKKEPVGILLLSEVALGDMYELKKASYMDKPPRGKHSTKGLGKTVPLESEFAVWGDEVVVPCGKPVSSSVRTSGLLYNEYIVYNTDQVKMQFLLKVRFHHKRA